MERDFLWCGSYLKKKNEGRETTLLSEPETNFVLFVILS